MSGPLRVLLVDDNPDDRELTRRELRRELGEFEAAMVRDRGELDRALEVGGFDLVVTDFSLGWTDGLEVVRRIKARFPDCPVIMLTGTGTEEVAVEAMKLGLDDYVLKQPQRLVRLGAAARAAIDTARLRVEGRRSDEALRESEERFRQMADHIEQVFYIGAADPPRMLYVSPAYEKIWGRSLRSLYDSPLSWLEGVLPEDRPRVEAAMREGIGAGAQLTRYRVRRPDGSIRWVEDRGVTVPDEHGRAYRVVGSVTDITDRRLAEEFREKLASLTASGIHPVLEFDASGAITYHNAAAEVIIEELDSTEPHEALQSEIQGIVSECLRTRERIIGLETVARGRTFSWAFVPVPERQVVHAYVSDISHHLEMEARLRQSERLEAVGRLAGGIAHDFNNLLTVIFGYAGILLEGLPPGSPLRGEVEEIRRAADRAVDLGRRLLACGRRQVVTPRVIDISRSAQGTLRMLGRLMPENIEVVWEPGEESVLARIDPGQMEQVLMNLALNARDAMPSGGRLAVRTGAVELARGYAPRHIGLPPGRYVTLQVEDTGSGIDETTMAHLFEPFHTTKERGRGTGLGLATVHGIVKQAGGDIWVDTEPGRGTTFTIYLPRVEAEAVPDGPPRPPRAAAGGSETILLAEDDERIREVAARALRSGGYTVLEASHGEEALDAVRRHDGPIHLIVSDVVMPRMGGADLTGRLTALRPGTKILYISGHTEGPGAAPGSIEGDDPFLAKPFTPDILVAKVRETLDGP